MYANFKSVMHFREEIGQFGEPETEPQLRAYTMDIEREV